MTGGTWARTLFAHAEELRDSRAPFVLATVVRARRPTSARPGDRALVLADGTVEGFVGGVCTESTVRLQGLRVLASGQPTILRITPDAAAGGADGEDGDVEGTVTVANPCLSGGAVDVFLEPQLPPPLVEVFGDSPVARALREVGEVLGHDVRACPAEPEFAADTEAVVVASHGRGEERVLTAALRAGVGYVGLVASPRRGRAVLADLGEPGAERVRTPAGLDIGARTPHEIALSVYAELLALRSRQEEPPRPEGREVTEAVKVTEVTEAVKVTEAVEVAAVTEAVDPVCGMTVAVSPVTPQSVHAGHRYYFCCDGCAGAFDADPERYARAGAAHAP
ncbi:XdhC family protein [Saccharomonospora cyanea]|uniref:Xanthine and CO dehydrogenases maturation factor, XdhC/CoxF family n=1 Tax=Saccharomonospora cyanea NA-134 TaxID=882082 RepID=H5XH69_9PSEU|nr:XdhC family protein [Saccharomonospora cyanea]EHR59540.1 xanthine and CO dehydrogenases maturation factor, XdhC/CoxF family [Saccharomonospora cyanea NA-134]